MTINGYKKVKEITYDSCAGCDLLINGLCLKVKKLGLVDDCIGVIYKKDKKLRRL